MTHLTRTLARGVSCAALALTLAASAAVAQAPKAGAQTGAPAAAPAPSAAKPSPAAIAAARDILTMKNASAMYSSAVPSMVQRTKDQLTQSNLNYQKELNEVALVVVQQMNGREKEIGDEMARIYASDFTEQELKDLVVFYKSPLGQKLLAQEPRSIQNSMAFMNSWAQNFSEQVNAAFRAEMRKRGKEI